MLRVQHRQIRSQIQFDYIGDDVSVCACVFVVGGWHDFTLQMKVSFITISAEVKCNKSGFRLTRQVMNKGKGKYQLQRRAEPLTLALLRGSDSVGSHVAAAAGVSVD